MMTIPRQYEPDLRLLARARERQGTGHRGDILLSVVFEHGFEHEQLHAVITDRMALFTFDGFFGHKPAEWLATFRAEYGPQAWFFLARDRWEDDRACSDRMHQALGYAHVPADNDNHQREGQGPASRSYPVVVPPAWEREVRALAADLGISARAALCAVLEVAFCELRAREAARQHDA